MKAIKPQEKNKGYLVNLASTLIVLRGQTVEGIGREAGIPVKNLQTFLQGVPMALSPEHAVKFFYYLGVGKKQSGATGLLSDCVHHFVVKQENIEIVNCLKPLLPDCQAVILPVEKSGLFPILIFNNETRILLLVKVSNRFGIRKKLQTDKLWFAGNDQEKILYKGSTIPADYIRQIFDRQLGMVDFDALAKGSFPDWTIFRQIANSHGITYNEIKEFLKNRSQAMRIENEAMEDQKEEAAPRDFTLVHGSGHFLNTMVMKEVVNE